MLWFDFKISGQTQTGNQGHFRHIKTFLPVFYTFFSSKIVSPDKILTPAFFSHISPPKSDLRNEPFALPYLCPGKIKDLVY
ncbi:MAG: hypothetical protein D6714_14820 [Bacteroidetes bacterium]|nr:MAG: hypothetical protein D6714_14820 [Bacteroidota bacterium]